MEVPRMKLKVLSAKASKVQESHGKVVTEMKKIQSTWMDIV